MGSNSLGKLFIELGLKSSLRGDLGQVQAQVGSFDNSVKNLNTSVKSSEAAFLSYGAVLKGVFATAGIAAGTFAAREALNIESIEKSFGKLVSSQGKDVNKYLANLKSASKGTISEAQLMTQANKAMLLGLSPDAVASMAAGATVIAQATGDSSAYLFESMALGVARQSRLLLDNLGILVDVDTANQKYADSIGKTVSALTEEERKIAFTSAAMAGLADRVDSLGGYSDTTKSEIDQLRTNLLDLSADVGKVFLPAIDEAVTSINEWGDAGGWDALSSEMDAFSKDMKDSTEDVWNFVDALKEAHFKTNRFLLGAGVPMADAISDTFRYFEMGSAADFFAPSQGERAILNTSSYKDYLKATGQLKLPPLEFNPLENPIYNLETRGLGDLQGAIDKNTEAVNASTEAIVDWTNAGKNVNENYRDGAGFGTIVGGNTIYNVTTGESHDWSGPTHYKSNSSGAK